MTLNTGEFPSVARESTLSQILQPNAPEKYYLSPKACLGILRRALKRGKELPTMLEEALSECVRLGGEEFGPEEIANAGEILRTLWEKVGTQTFGEWIRRAVVLVQQEKVLLCGLRQQDNWGDALGGTCELAKNKQETCEKNDSICPMRYLWKNWIHGSSPQGREPDEQFSRELGALVQKLSCQPAPFQTFMRCLRSASEGTPALRETLASVEEEYQAWLGHRIHGEHQGKDESGEYIGNAADAEGSDGGSGLNRGGFVSYEDAGRWFTFNESGQGYWMPGFGCLRAEGENRPSRPNTAVVTERDGVDCMNPWDSQSIRQYGVDGVWPNLNANSGGGQNRCGVCYETARNLMGGEPASFKGKSSPSAGGIGFGIGVAPTLVAGQEAHCVYAWTYRGRDGGCNVEAQKDTAYALREPSGGGSQPNVCYAIQGNTIDRGSAQNGSGVCEDVSPTINTQDRHGVVYPEVARALTARHDSSPCVDRGQETVVYRSGSYGSYRNGVGTLRAAGGDMGGVRRVSSLSVYDARGNGNGVTAPTLTGDHQNRVTDYTALCVERNCDD